MSLAYEVMNNLESNRFISYFLTSKSLSADEMNLGKSCWTILPDLINSIICNIVPRTHDYNIKGDPLIQEDFVLLRQLIQYSFCIPVCIYPSFNQDIVHKSDIIPVLKGTFGLLTDLLTRSFQRYFDQQNKVDKYPLDLMINLCSLKLSPCIKRYLLEDIESMVLDSLKATEMVSVKVFALNLL